MSVKVHEAFSLDSFQDRLLWFDDFHGDQLQDEWDAAGTGSAVVVDAQTGGIVRITTGAIVNNNYRIDWADIRSLLVTKKATMEVRAKLAQTPALEAKFELFFDGTHYIRFIYDTGIGPNWLTRCRDGGAEASQDSGIAADTDYHIFRIECQTHGGSHIHFYIDGTETANSPLTTNIPTDYLQPRPRILTRANVAKSMDIDYCYIRQERT